ncbi:Ig-like domain-containing protein, partial [Mycolicibacterium diernhoferi]|uniref:Ig-like domain-containing protein n=1 Tax=Mycolicibacterium diernhoferi TaxID=1801 RepID=UPI0021F2E8BD
MATRLVTVSVLGKNAVPTVAGTTTVGAPDADGVVSGNLGALDADGDALSFKASAKKGVVDVAADGTFTFTPTAAARHAASAVGAKASVTSETFTVTVTDGFG